MLSATMCDPNRPRPPPVNPAGHPGISRGGTAYPGKPMGGGAATRPGYSPVALFTSWVRLPGPLASRRGSRECWALVIPPDIAIRGKIPRRSRRETTAGNSPRNSPGNLDDPPVNLPGGYGSRSRLWSVRPSVTQPYKFGVYGFILALSRPCDIAANLPPIGPSTQAITQKVAFYTAICAKRVNPSK